MDRDPEAPGQQEVFDDIPIPPPRVAGVWYCSKCGDSGAEPEPGFLRVDARYAVGYCDCTGGRRNRVSGYKREPVQLVADFAWDREEWQKQRERQAEKKAWEKIGAGLSASPEEHRLAERFRYRNAVPKKEG